MRGAIVLAGGSSTRMGRPKAFVPVAGVPLIVLVVRVAAQIADEVVVVTKPPQVQEIRELVRETAYVVADVQEEQSPLVGFASGAAALKTEYTAFLGCDLPFLSPEILDLLFEAAFDVDAVIPRWPDGKIEPMEAVYHRERAATAALAALRGGRYANSDMIAGLRKVRYVNVEGLRSLDSLLDSFLNVNTPKDLAVAEARAKSRGRPV